MARDCTQRKPSLAHVRQRRFSWKRAESLQEGAEPGVGRDSELVTRGIRVPASRGQSLQGPLQERIAWAVTQIPARKRLMIST